MRPGDWQIGASIQQQLLPRVSAEIGYTRRWLTNFPWDDNVLQATNQFDTFSITAPNDTRLPEEARGRTLSGLYNVQQSVASQVNNITKLASDAGGDYTQVYNGFLLNVSARLRNGLTFQGGMATGTTDVDYCGVRAAAPEYTVLGCAESDQSVVRHLHGLGDAVHRSRFVHRAEDRRARLGHVPQRQGVAAGGEHGVHERSDDARPRVRQQRAERDRQPHRAGHAVWRPRERDRPAGREDPAGSAGREPTSGSTSTTS